MQEYNAFTTGYTEDEIHNMKYNETSTVYKCPICGYYHLTTHKRS